MTYLDRNVAQIRTRIADAAQSAGRAPEEITLLAAVKSGEIGEIRYLHRDLGIRDLGENRVQQFLEHYEALREEKDIRWHFIVRMDCFTGIMTTASSWPSARC